MQYISLPYHRYRCAPLLRVALAEWFQVLSYEIVCTLNRVLRSGQTSVISEPSRHRRTNRCRLGTSLAKERLETYINGYLLCPTSRLVFSATSRGLPAQYFLQLLLQHDLGSAAANVALSPAPSQKGCGCTADRHIENSQRESSWR
jgi:hypothetical protein